MPPNAAGVTTARVAVWLPPPHVVEHAENADQAVTMQSTGQPCVLQDCDCDRDVGHAAPPFKAACVTLRVCTWMPPPHLTEQADQSDQVDTPQSTAPQRQYAQAQT